MAKVRLFVADDHAMVVEALKKLLEPRFEVVGTASDGRQVLELAVKADPDVVLLDLAMPSLDGFQAGQQLKRLLPATKIIVVTTSVDFDIANHALHEWASGYVIKTCSGAELANAIISVMAGHRYVTRSIANAPLDQFISDTNKAQSMALTFRQREVLHLLVEGGTMQEVANELQLTARTVAFHKYKIMREHGLRSNADLTRFAIKQRVASAAFTEKDKIPEIVTGAAAHESHTTRSQMSRR